LQALIVPRPGAESGEHWYSYVAERVGRGAVPGLTAAEVRAPAAADSDAAGSLILIGHEQGVAQVADFLSSLPKGRTAAGTLLVAPPTSEGDWRAAGPLRVLLSDDPGYEELERVWAEHHGAEVALRPRGRSFHGAHEVSVLINLAALAMEIAEQV
jgi:predicted alpha/beta hydrolase family esterase